MTRKRSAYRPKRNVQNPVALVLGRLAPVTSCVDDYTVMSARIELALSMLTTGKATASEIKDLINTSNMAQALKRQGYGVDYAAELHAGADAVEAVSLRHARIGRYVATGPELMAIRALVEIHDAQLEAVTVGELQAGIDTVNKKVKEPV